LLKKGAIISKRRKLLGISQVKLAEICNLHRNTIGEIERGDLDPSIIIVPLITIAPGINEYHFSGYDIGVKYGDIPWNIGCKPEYVIYIIFFAPFHHFLTAESAVAAKYYSNIRPFRSYLIYNPFYFFFCAGTRIYVRLTQFSGMEIIAAKNIQR
jgi:DNA-binding XRE family transcriptional regulator